MDINDWKIIIEVVSIVITMIVTAYNLLIKNNKKKSIQYFDKILLQFINAYHIDNTVDCIKYIKNKISREDEYIPTYLYYLVDNNENNKLKKVLLYDYCRLYKNDDNDLYNIFRVINKIVYYVSILICSCLTVFVMFESLAFLIFLVVDLKSKISGTVSIFGLEYSTITWDLIFILICIIVIFILYIIIEFLQYRYEDDYTLKTKKIKNLINKKVRSYDKHYKKYYIF